MTGAPYVSMVTVTPTTEIDPSVFYPVSLHVNTSAVGRLRNDWYG